MEEWSALEASWRANVPESLGRLGAPADANTVDAAEREMGVELPADYRASVPWWALHEKLHRAIGKHRDVAGVHVTAERLRELLDAFPRLRDILGERLTLLVPWQS